MTKSVQVGRVRIGGGAPVSIQSMTNTDTRDAQSTANQIRALADAGCELVRVSVYDEECVRAARSIVDASPVPLIADVHFRADLAVGAIESGFAKLRINPGNIGGEANIRRVADCAKAYGIPIRVGVNSGSLDKKLLTTHGHPTPEALVESALDSVRMLERAGFDGIVVAVKTSSVRDTIDAYRLLSKQCDYPLHIGVTEAGLPEDGSIKSAVALGALLADGIGDTLRVSLSGDPVPEVQAGLQILRALGLRDGVDVIACPTCGRACIDVTAVARQVKDALDSKEYAGIGNLRVAVMGCVVNGPGEAREADIGIAGAPDGAALFVKGEPPVPVRGDPAQVLIEAITRRWR
ncbi:4-hydroxy-3-methylbut-2-en-1-yl diphosphate synthase (flavodoxin) [Clostridia bacterium]|nr:4-hydroxy-3-methylbut-2-en-1-yl diphosphate synthase (flavodoxin) [Clostridia bacterium]